MPTQFQQASKIKYGTRLKSAADALVQFCDKDFDLITELQQFAAFNEDEKNTNLPESDDNLNDLIAQVIRHVIKQYVAENPIQTQLEWECKKYLVKFAHSSGVVNLELMRAELINIVTLADNNPPILFQCIDDLFGSSKNPRPIPHPIEKLNPDEVAALKWNEDHCKLGFAIINKIDWQESIEDHVKARVLRLADILLHPYSLHEQLKKNPPIPGVNNIDDVYLEAKTFRDFFEPGGELDKKTDKIFQLEKGCEVLMGDFITILDSAAATNIASSGADLNPNVSVQDHVAEWNINFNSKKQAISNIYWLGLDKSLVKLQKKLLKSLELGTAWGEEHQQFINKLRDFALKCATNSDSQLVGFYKEFKALFAERFACIRYQKCESYFNVGIFNVFMEAAVNTYLALLDKPEHKCCQWFIPTLTSTTDLHALGRLTLSDDGEQLIDIVKEGEAYLKDYKDDDPAVDSLLNEYSTRSIAAFNWNFTLQRLRQFFKIVGHDKPQTLYDAIAYLAMGLKNAGVKGKGRELVIDFAGQQARVEFSDFLREYENKHAEIAFINEYRNDYDEFRKAFQVDESYIRKTFVNSYVDEFNLFCNIYKQSILNPVYNLLYKYHTVSIQSAGVIVDENDENDEDVPVIVDELVIGSVFRQLGFLGHQHLENQGKTALDCGNELSDKLINILCVSPELLPEFLKPSDNHPLPIYFNARFALEKWLDGKTELAVATSAPITEEIRKALVEFYDAASILMVNDVELNEPLLTFLVNLANNDITQRTSYCRQIFADIWTNPKGKAELQRLTVKCQTILMWPGAQSAPEHIPAFYTWFSKNKKAIEFGKELKKIVEDQFFPTELFLPHDYDAAIHELEFNPAAPVDVDEMRLTAMLLIATEINQKLNSENKALLNNAVIPFTAYSDKFSGFRSFINLNNYYERLSANKIIKEFVAIYGENGLIAQLQIDEVLSNYNKFLTEGIHGLPGQFLRLQETQHAADHLEFLKEKINAGDFKIEDGESAKVAIEKLKICYNQECTPEDIKTRILEFLIEINNNIFVAIPKAGKRIVVALCHVDHLNQVKTDLKTLIADANTQNATELMNSLRQYVAKHMRFIHEQSHMQEAFEHLAAMCKLKNTNEAYNNATKKWKEILRESILSTVEITKDMEKNPNYAELICATKAVYDNIWMNTGDRDKALTAFMKCINAFQFYKDWQNVLATAIKDCAPELRSVLEYEKNLQRTFEAQIKTKKYEDVNFREQIVRIARWNYLTKWNTQPIAKDLLEQIERYNILIKKLRQIDPLNAKKDAALILINKEKKHIVESLIANPECPIEHNKEIDNIIDTIEIKLRKRALTDFGIRSDKDGIRIAEAINDQNIELSALRKLCIEYKLERDWAPATTAQNNSKSSAFSWRKK